MRYPFEEFTRVHWLPGEDAVAAIAAPTVAEINAGTDITCFLTKDGLNPGGTTNKIDQAGLCSRLDAQGIGSVGYDMSLKAFRDNAAGGDDAWDLFEWNSPGTLVVRRGVAYATAFAAAQKVEVYVGASGEPVPAGSAANAQQTFEVPIAVAEAQLKAAVAA